MALFRRRSSGTPGASQRGSGGGARGPCWGAPKALAEGALARSRAGTHGHPGEGPQRPATGAPPRRAHAGIATARVAGRLASRELEPVRPRPGQVWAAVGSSDARPTHALVGLGRVSVRRRRGLAHAAVGPGPAAFPGVGPRRNEDRGPRAATRRQRRSERADLDAPKLLLSAARRPRRPTRQRPSSAPRSAADRGTAPGTRPDAAVARGTTRRASSATPR